MALNIADLFEHAVDAAPDNLALKVGDRTITYAGLEAEANKLAHYLQSRGWAGATTSPSTRRTRSSTSSLCSPS